MDSGEAARTSVIAESGEMGLCSGIESGDKGLSSASVSIDAGDSGLFS